MFYLGKGETLVVPEASGEGRSDPDALWVVSCATRMHCLPGEDETFLGKVAFQVRFRLQDVIPASRALLQLLVDGGDPIEAWEGGPTCCKLVVPVCVRPSVKQQ
mgnify:CR=1 FL=1